MTNVEHLVAGIIAQHEEDKRRTDASHSRIMEEFGNVHGKLTAHTERFDSVDDKLNAVNEKLDQVIRLLQLGRAKPDK
ncbi:hypothetical protein CRH09_35875 [Nocardia terpenica]|uniref:Uncharacterized protein n=2 Tax=Nocardia terpenica TaxID=455432 RepID=A0A291RT98_9NOCA|nr:hypothetical protein CRH09_35875 [Nocardia terpenica]